MHQLEERRVEPFDDPRERREILATESLPCSELVQERNRVIRQRRGAERKKRLVDVNRAGRDLGFFVDDRNGLPGFTLSPDDESLRVGQRRLV